MNRWLRSALLASAAAIVVAGTANAATIRVTTKKDEFGAGSKCSLREAVQAANTDKRFGGCRKGKGADAIVLGRGTYKLSIPGTKEDENADGDLDSLANLRIRGKGRGRTTIDGNGDVVGERILERVQGNLIVRDLTLRNAVADVGGAVAALHASAAGGALTLRGVSVEHNLSYQSGGGIGVERGSLRVLSSRIVENAAGDWGAGIYFNAPARITIERSLIADNIAEDGSAGFDIDHEDAQTVIDRTVIRDNVGPLYGGGGYLEGGSARISRSTISGNRGGHDLTNSYGGGLHVAVVSEGVVIERTTIARNNSRYAGGVYANTPIVFRNSTIARNYAAEEGGGLWVASFPVTLESATVARNHAVLSGGGIYAGIGPLRYRNSIIARNSVASGSEDCSAPAVSLGHNLLGDGSCPSVASDISGVWGAPLDPRLGPLGNHGGPTQTIPLLAGSPAINKGQGCPKRDQRGRKRKGRCDIGAFER